jgi:putative ABC transport system permease protein
MTSSVRVPVGRRLLFADRRRGALTIAGVAAALLLVLTLDAIFAGAVRRVTAYLRTSPADVVVSQAGVRTMHMSASTVPPGTSGRAATVAGVAWTAPIGFSAGTLLTGPRGQQLSYLIGYDTHTGRGGPAHLSSGRPPGMGEAVVDGVAARQLGLSLGTDTTVFGTRLRIVGTTSGLTSITNTTVFVSQAQFAALRGPATSYLLVRAKPGVSAKLLASRLSAGLPDVTVQTRRAFVASEGRIVTDMSADLIRLMAGIGLLIAIVVVALGLLTTTLARVRDYAVLKAIGASTPRLAATIAAQAGWTVVLALAVATGAVLLLTLALPALTPTVALTVTANSIADAGAAALAAGVIASLLPLRRVSTIDAATAFREAR